MFVKCLHFDITILDARTRYCHDQFLDNIGLDVWTLYHQAFLSMMLICDARNDVLILKQEHDILFIFIGHEHVILIIMQEHDILFIFIGHKHVILIIMQDPAIFIL